MRTLSSVPNVDAASADYPKGRVRNKNGVIVGTTITEELHGDLIQLCQKLIIDAGITENALPDNVTNGYQLLTALNAKIKEQTQATPTLVVEFNGAYASGNIDLAVQTYDRQIYALNTGTITAPFLRQVKLDTILIGDVLDLVPFSFLLPAGMACQFTRVTGSTTNFKIMSIKVGQ